MLKDIVILNNYNQGIIIDNPTHYNDIKKLNTALLEMLYNNHKIQLQKEEK